MLVAFVPVFIFFLRILQLGLLASAKLVVKHSANVRARSAVVVLEDDPWFYGNAARGALTGGRTDEDKRVGDFPSKIGGMRKDGGNFTYCAIAIARQLVCNPGYDLIGLGKSIRELASIGADLSSSPSLSELERANSRPKALGNRLRTQKKQALELFSELQRAESPGLAVVYLLCGHYAPLEGEATLPNQSASYEPRTAPPANSGKRTQRAL